MPTESKRAVPGLTRASCGFRRWHLALLVLWSCSSAACSQCASKTERVSSGYAPSTAASGAAAPPPTEAPEQPAAGAKAPSPIATPSIPPQLVACGQRDFQRITRSSLQTFEIAEQLPPPHIRGSGVARQAAQLDMADPLNLLSLSKGRALVIAKSHLFLYELGQPQTRRYAPIAESAPLLAGSDPASPDSFWVRTLASESLSHYELSSLAPSGGTSSARQKGPSRMQPLPGFDSRLFTALADGTPLYSTTAGLLRVGSAAGAAPLPALGTPVLLFADSSPARYWAADASGKLVLSELDKGDSPVVTARVPGVVLDTAREGERVAVLSLELQGQSYRPSVTIFERGEQRGQLSVGPSIATGTQPQLDLCLIAGRPWVVAGGRHWLQLLDWSAPRLLAEW